MHARDKDKNVKEDRFERDIFCMYNVLSGTLNGVARALGSRFGPSFRINLPLGNSSTDRIVTPSTRASFLLASFESGFAYRDTAPCKISFAFAFI